MDNASSHVEPGASKRDFTGICGAVLLSAIVVFMVFGLRFYASIQVLIVLIFGEMLLCIATKASKASLGVVLSLTLLVSFTLLEADNYVQYGGLKLWGPPQSITMCGITRHFDGFTRILDDGDGPPLQKITTSPSGLTIYGTRGCPETPLYVHDRGSYLLYGT